MQCDFARTIYNLINLVVTLYDASIDLRNNVVINKVVERVSLMATSEGTFITE